MLNLTPHREIRYNWTVAPSENACYKRIEVVVLTPDWFNFQKKPANSTPSLARYLVKKLLIRRFKTQIQGPHPMFFTSGGDIPHVIRRLRNARR